jgi:serine/threonine-protein kinase
MWLGVQFGEARLSSDRPPAVTSVQNVEAPRGGSGAGDAPTDAEAIRTEPKANTEPLYRTKDARPKGTKSASPSPSPSDKPSTPSASPSSPTSSDPGGESPSPPTESTAPTTDPPPTDDPDPDVPPTDPETEPQSDPVTAQTSLV